LVNPPRRRTHQQTRSTWHTRASVFEHIIRDGSVALTEGRLRKAYQRTASMITSGGNRNPAKMDRGAGAARRRGISSVRYSLSYRDVAELLAERGIAVDHVTISRWVQRFT
jgi:hypothetical protein